MKWEKLKEKVASEVYTAILTCENYKIVADVLVDLIHSDFEVRKTQENFKETVKIYAEKAYETIMQWDVRCVGKLRNLFPGHFPKTLSTGKLVAYMADNEDSDWIVDREI